MEGCKPSDVSSRKHNEFQNCPSGETAPALPKPVKAGIVAMVKAAIQSR